MVQLPTVSPKILFLFSDTGGGHRSAAEAIIEALHLNFGDAISTEMVDIIKQYAPRPLNRLPDLYPSMVRLPRVWGFGYRLSDGRHRARLLNASSWPYVSKSIRALVANNPCDLIVSVHPLATAPVIRALNNTSRPPLITVVTDLVSTHAFWYHPQTDLCLVPTENARQRALHYGLKPEIVQVTGLPVANRFCQPASDKQHLRASYGWPANRPLIMLVGGGEGMGPIEKTAHAIAQADLPISLVVITGRNESLKARLESYNWSIPTYIYGFVRSMPDFMQAADILVTKAGPGTISEALNAGLPMVLYSRLPGQESGNIDYITSEGAGIWAPQVTEIVAAIRHWIDHPLNLEQARLHCQRLARPHAAHHIAQILVEKVGIPIS
ncbi:MAG: galactosyldiacylglycerol synthase [Anaerolineales bacterium]|nr:MAG: galactosyldiacylglycerol synthase [Anaerolineales bacterium]